MNASTISQTWESIKLIPCRLTGRTLDFESSNSGSKPDEGTKRSMFDEIMQGFEEMKVLRAIKLEPNNTYVIECEPMLSLKIKHRITEQLQEATKDLNIRFLILDGGMKIAKEQQSLS